MWGTSSRLQLMEISSAQSATKPRPLIVLLEHVFYQLFLVDFLHSITRYAVHYLQQLGCLVWRQAVCDKLLQILKFHLHIVHSLGDAYAQLENEP